MVRPDDSTSTREILEWTFAHAGGTVGMSTAFGPSGIVLMHLCCQLQANLKVFFLDTGFHFQETLNLAEEIRIRLPIDLEILRPTMSLVEQATLHGAELPVLNSDACCRIRKVEPTRRMLSQLDVWMTALRRDQGPSRAQTAHFEDQRFEGRALLKVNPLAHWDRRKIWAYILQHNLPYNRLLDQGYNSIGCSPCTSISRDEDYERAGRWAQSGKTECGMHTQVWGS